MKRLLLALLFVVLVFVIAVTGGSFYMLSYSLSPDDNRRDTDSFYVQLFERYPDIQQWTDSIRGNNLLRDTFVTMPTGERHHALYMRNDSACGRTALIVHGYKDCGVKFLYLGRMYFEGFHYNILLPDLHAHGLSDGEAIGMGWNERKDIIHWISLIDSIFPDSIDNSSIVLHGVSMGAATVMNVSGEMLPPTVKAIIEDCGYTSAWDEFACQLTEQFGLPAFPLMYSTSILCRLRYGWFFSDDSPLKQVAKATVPMLFIHGGNDSFVPTWMIKPLSDAYRDSSKRKVWMAPGSDHASSFRVPPRGI